MITTTSYVDRQPGRRTAWQWETGARSSSAGQPRGLRGGRHLLGPSLPGKEPNHFLITRDHKKPCFPTVL